MTNMIVLGPTTATTWKQTISSTAVAFTNLHDAQSTPYEYCTLTVEDAPMRIAFSATPTATLGHLLRPGDTFTLHSHDAITDFKAIRNGSTDATIQVTMGYVR